MLFKWWKRFVLLEGEMIAIRICRKIVHIFAVQAYDTMYHIHFIRIYSSHLASRYVYLHVVFNIFSDLDISSFFFRHKNDLFSLLLYQVKVSRKVISNSSINILYF